MSVVLLFAVALAACLPPEAGVPDGFDADEVDALAQAFGEASLEARLDLFTDVEELVQSASGCPSHLDDPEGARERWTGECEQQDGTRITGVLERYEGSEFAWIAGDHFQVLEPSGEVSFYLDGGVELRLLGEMWVVEAALTSCGGGGPACEGLAGDLQVTTLDLAYTLFPASTYPERYDVTISGVVVPAGDEPATIHGTWSVDRATCAGEPASGSVVVGLEQSNFLDFDGGRSCDGCADRTADSRYLGLTCATWMP